MCLAIPARIVEVLPNDEGVVDLGGVRKRISLELVSDVVPGDYVKMRSSPPWPSTESSPEPPARWSPAWLPMITSLPAPP